MPTKDPFSPPLTHATVRKLLAEAKAENDNLKRTCDVLAWYVSTFREQPGPAPALARASARAWARRRERQANRRANGQ
jgi:hypothetical protein